MYTPPEPRMRPPLWVTLYHMQSLGYQLRANGSAAPASGAYDVTNRIHYFPIVLPTPSTLYRTFWLNGATVGTNNFQVGIYNDNDAGTDGPGTALFRGTSTLSAGTANRPQYVNETDTPIPAGRFWLAIWGSGTTATIFRQVLSATFARNLLSFGETNAGGLPTTATPVQQATSFLPVFGFTTVAGP